MMFDYCLKGRGGKKQGLFKWVETAQGVPRFELHQVPVKNGILVNGDVDSPTFFRQLCACEPRLEKCLQSAWKKMALDGMEISEKDHAEFECWIRLSQGRKIPGR
jgi:hypothetical protein